MYIAWNKINNGFLSLMIIPSLFKDLEICATGNLISWLLNHKQRTYINQLNSFFL